MTIRPEYSKYSQRIFKGLVSVILLSIAWTLFLFFNDFNEVGMFIVLVSFAVLSLVLIISTIRKSKYYLTEIKIDGEDCEFTVYEFDKPKETIKTKLSETRIKIWELFFPFTKFGRNFKLIIEIKQGAIYKRIVQQHEVGNWNLNEFKKVMNLYGESKGVITSTASFKRSNF